MKDEDEVVTGEFAAVAVTYDDEGNPVIPRVTDEWMWAMQRSVTNLRKSPRFRVDAEDYFRPVPDIVRETVESAAGMTAAPTIASLYELTDGFELAWSYDDGDGTFVPGGTVHLYGFAEVFGSWLHKLWGEHPDDASSAQEDFTWELRALDSGDPEDPHQVVMHTPEVLPTYNLYWHAPNGTTYPLRVDFLGYLERLTQTCGLHGWQYMIADVDLDADPEARRHVVRCTRLMRKLFPSVDLSGYATLDAPEGEDDGSEEE